MSRLFISYSHDSSDHKNRVRALTERLRRDGFDARLDQFEAPQPADGWPAWSSRQIINARFVLLICTKPYFQRFMGLSEAGNGRGVRWESRIIQNVLYYDYLRVGFVPVLMTREDEPFIPPAVSGGGKIILNDERQPGQDGYQKLIAQLGHDPSWTPLASPLLSPEIRNEVAIPTDASVPSVELWNLVERQLSHISESLDGRFAPSLLRQKPYQGPKTADAGIADLRYDRQWLGFRQRPFQHRMLDSFIHDEATFRWWGIVGEGGVGKTREAFELALRLSELGWDAGFLATANAQSWLSQDCKGWRPRQPTLILVDYATQRSRVLLDGLYHLSVSLGSADHAMPKVRMLLLDRPGRVYPAVSELIPMQSHHEEICDTVRAFLYRPPSVKDRGPVIREQIIERELARELTTPLVRDSELLQITAIEPEQWREVLVEVVRQSGVDPGSIPSSDQRDWWERVDRLTGHGRLLFLQVLGLCFARNPALVRGLSGGDGLNELLDTMLAHESDRRWPDLFPNEMGQTRAQIRDSSDYRHVLYGAAFVTLSRGLYLPDDSDRLLQAAGGAPDLLRTVLLRLLHCDVNQDDSGQTHFHLPPLEPDLIGERLLLHLSRSESNKSDSLGLVPQTVGIDTVMWLRNALQANPAGTMQSLLLLSQDFPNEPETIGWIESLLMLLSDSQDANTSDDIQYWTGTMVPTLFVTLMESGTSVSEALWNKLLAFANKSEFQWRSTFVDFIEALPRCVQQDTSKQTIERVASELTQSQLLRTVSFDTRLLLSKGAVNVVNYYGSAGDWKSLERWGRVLVEQSAAYGDQPEIQLRLSKGAFNAVNYYGSAGDWESLERWGRVLSSSLNRACIDDVVFGRMVEFCLQFALRSDHYQVTEVFVLLIEYWPGYTIHHDSGSIAIAQIGLEMPAMTVEQRRRVERVQGDWSRWLVNANALRAAIESGLEIDPQAVRACWRDRMYSPDRGDCLSKLLQHMQMTEEMYQYAQDPWRREPLG